MFKNDVDYTYVVSKALKEVEDSVTIIGSTLLVQVLDHEEPKTKSGLIVPADDRHIRKSFTDRSYTWCRVLATGEGYYDEEGKEIPVDSQVGNIILVSPDNVAAFTNFGNILGGKIARVDDGAVALRFKDTAAALTFFNTLNEG